MQFSKRAIRIGNSSGGIGDGPRALYRLATEGPIDAITADYLAEVNLAWRALELRDHPEKGFEPGFLGHLEPAIAIVEEKKIKLVHNGGALNPRALAEATSRLLLKYNSKLKVAYVEGDNITAEIKAMSRDSVAQLRHLDIEGKDLSSVTKEILTANGYIGMGGIVAALNQGADIVICGRCTDASPVMGLAAWWHGWGEEQYNELAGALMAGQCGCYVTGGNFSGFRSIKENWDQGYPVAEIRGDGSFDIYLQDNVRGLVSRDTVTAELVYEIQGPYYLNPDVVADITNVQVKDTGRNRVSVSGIKGSPPPPTTKLAICTIGGYQLDSSMFAVGLDIEGKLEAFRDMIRLTPNSKDYSVLRIDSYGTAQVNPKSQFDATVRFRIFAQAEKAETLLTLGTTIMAHALGGFCGLHGNIDPRPAEPKMFAEYTPFTVPQEKIKLRVTFVGDEDKPIAVSSPKKTQKFPGQKSYEPTDRVDLPSFGATTFAALGLIVHARSGDKGSNANAGFWVRHDDEWPWLRSFLDTKKFKELLGDDFREEYRIDRFELPNLRAVHFLTYGILEGGIASTYKLDGLAKSYGEYIRSKYVEIPNEFLQRGTISPYILK